MHTWPLSPCLHLQHYTNVWWNRSAAPALQEALQSFPVLLGFLIGVASIHTKSDFLMLFKCPAISSWESWGSLLLPWAVSTEKVSSSDHSVLQTFTNNMLACMQIVCILTYCLLHTARLPETKLSDLLAQTARILFLLIKNFPSVTHYQEGSVYLRVKVLLWSMRFSYLFSFCDEVKNTLSEKLLKFPGNFRKATSAKACEYTQWLCSQYSWKEGRESWLLWRQVFFLCRIHFTVGQRMFCITRQ